MAAAPSTHSLPLLLLLLLLAVVLLQAEAHTALPPAPSGPLSLTGILDQSGQYTTFSRLLTQTNVAPQLQSELTNPTTKGLTVLAPTDNAFTNLKAGTLDGLSSQQKVQLVNYHVLPKYYSPSSLLKAPNPVSTRLSSQSGTYGLNFTGSGGNVTVSSGGVTTPINKTLTEQFPLSMYQVDKVLLPNDMFAEASPAPVASKTPAPVASKTPAGSTNTTPVAAGPSADVTSGASKTSVGTFVGLALGLALFFMGSS